MSLVVVNPQRIVKCADMERFLAPLSSLFWFCGTFPGSVSLFHQTSSDRATLPAQQQTDTVRDKLLNKVKSEVFSGLKLLVPILNRPVQNSKQTNSGDRTEPKTIIPD